MPRGELDGGRFAVQTRCNGGPERTMASAIPPKWLRHCRQSPFTSSLERLFRDRLAQCALGGRNTRACNEFVQRCEKRRRQLAGVRDGRARRGEAEADGTGVA